MIVWDIVFTCCSRTSSCFGAYYHSSFLRILQYISSICVAPFILRHPDSVVSWPQLDLNLGQIWWLEYISKGNNNVLSWPGKVMSCPAHLAGGPVVIVSFLTRLTIPPWGNCKTYSISCSWWILCESKSDLCLKTMQCYLEACLWYSGYQ